jgi:hypothetical protein
MMMRSVGCSCQAEVAAKGGMEADDLLCSRNARPMKALVERAQWKISQLPSLKILSELGGSIYISAIDRRTYLKIDWVTL